MLVFLSNNHFSTQSSFLLFGNFGENAIFAISSKSTPLDSTALKILESKFQSEFRLRFGVK